MQTTRGENTTSHQETSMSTHGAAKGSNAPAAGPTPRCGPANRPRSRAPPPLWPWRPRDRVRSTRPPPAAARRRPGDPCTRRCGRGSRRALRRRWWRAAPALLRLRLCLRLPLSRRGVGQHVPQGAPPQQQPWQATATGLFHSPPPPPDHPPRPGAARPPRPPPPSATWGTPAPAPRRWPAAAASAARRSRRPLAAPPSGSPRTRGAGARASPWPRDGPPRVRHPATCVACVQMDVGVSSIATTATMCGTRR